MAKLILLVWFIFLFAYLPAAGQPPQTNIARIKSSDAQKLFAVNETARIIAEVVKDSYPELENVQISVKTFYSSSDYFRSQFSVSRFLTFRRLHYTIFVNPQVFAKNAPASGIRAILAHELAHAVYYRKHNRFELLGLIRLDSKSFAARFERGADLQAIKRGYGAGLKDYREWLYQNIPAKQIIVKKRNYFSPEEIDLIMNSIGKRPDLINYWLKNVPRSLAEIKLTINTQLPIER